MAAAKCPRCGTMHTIPDEAVAWKCPTCALDVTNWKCASCGTVNFVAPGPTFKCASCGNLNHRPGATLRQTRPVLAFFLIILVFTVVVLSFSWLSGGSSCEDLADAGENAVAEGDYDGAIAILDQMESEGCTEGFYFEDLPAP